MLGSGNALTYVLGKQGGIIVEIRTLSYGNDSSSTFKMGDLEYLPNCVKSRIFDAGGILQQQFLFFEKHFFMGLSPFTSVPATLMAKGRRNLNLDTHFQPLRVRKRDIRVPILWSPEMRQKIRISRRRLNSIIDQNNSTSSQSRF